MRRSAAVLAVLVAALLAPAGAAAQTTPPLAIDATVDPAFAEPDFDAASVGAADDGDAVAVWRDAGPAPTPVKLALWEAGNPAPTVVGLGLGGSPDVAMAPDGHAIAVWTGSDGRLRIARRAPGAGFAAPATVDPPPPESAQPSRWGNAAVAIRGDGSGVVAVPSCRDFGASAQLSSHVLDVGPDGEPGAPVDAQAWVSQMGCGSLGSVRVAAGPDGQAAVAYCVLLYCKLGTRAAAGGVWAVRGVDGTEYAPSTDGAVPVITPQGKAIVLWRSDASPPSLVRAAIGTTATALTQLYEASDPSAASAAQELTGFGTDALAVWQTAASGGGVQVLARPVFAGGSYGPATVVSPLTHAGAPDVATWPDGTGVIAFADQPAADALPTLALRRRALGGTLTPMPITSLAGRAASLPSVALAGDGAAPLGIVATREAPPAPAPATIVLRRIDGIAPGLAISVPPSGAAGASVAMTAGATDTSAPVAISWDLGDGASAQGAVVQHTYATAGTRTVTATATDAAGNATTASASIEVAPAPDTAAPEITEARLAAKRFRPGRANTALTAAKRRAPRGTQLEVSLSEAAQLRIGVQRLRKGRRSGGRCRPKARTGKRCTVAKTLRTLRRTLPAGDSTIAFTARFRGKRLAAGRHRLRLVAVDASGNASAATKLRFRIVR